MNETADRSSFSLVRVLISFGLMLLLVLTFAAFAFYMFANQDKPRDRVVGEQSFPVTTQVLASENVTQALRVNGTVQAARQVDLRPLVAGRVIWVNPALRDGGQLAAGEKVLEINPSTYALNLRQAQNALKDAQQSRTRLEADLERQKDALVLAQQQLENAEAELTRRRALFEDGVISRGTLEQVETQTLSQRQSILATENGIDQLADQLAGLTTNIEAAEINVELAENNLSDTVLLAPYTGLVIASAVQEGQLVSQGDLAARLLDQDAMEVQFRVTQDIFAQLNASGGLIGQRVQVRWSGQTGAAPLTATIARQGSTLDPSAGGVPLFASLDADAFDQGLRPGAFVEVEMTGQSFGVVYAIPREAYFPDLGDGGIYLVDTQTVVQQPEWQGPTSTAVIQSMHSWLDDLAEDVDLATAIAPVRKPDQESDGPLSELYLCVPWQSKPDIWPPQPEHDTANGNQEEAPSRSILSEGRGQLFASKPDLFEDEWAALCPDIEQPVARATPVQFLTYTGDQALISAEEGMPLEGQTLITQRFDKLADGTWIRLETSQDAAQ